MTGPITLLARPYSRARGSLAWGIACFVAAQLAFLLAAEQWQPKLRDPEYGRKLERLRSRLAEHPQARPLILTLGSSRVSMGIRPDCLPAYAGTNGQPPLIFNFGLCKFSSLGELLCLRRLLDDGIRPDVVIVETWPPLMTREDYQLDILNPDRLSRRDLSVLRHYAPDPSFFSSQWWQRQVVPWYFSRATVLNRHCPTWLPPGEQSFLDWKDFDGWGWLARPEYRIAPGRERLHITMQGYREVWRWHFEKLGVSNPSSLRELLSLCREEGIGVVFLYLPEGSEFQTWDTPARRALSDDKLRRLGQEYGVPMIDGRNWVDDDGFIDGIHVCHESARVLTERFGCEVIAPLMDGRLRPGCVQEVP